MAKFFSRFYLTLPKNNGIILLEGLINKKQTNNPKNKKAKGKITFIIILYIYYIIFIYRAELGKRYRGRSPRISRPNEAL